MGRNTSPVEADGLLVEGTPTVVWVESDDDTNVFPRSRLESMATEIRL